MCTENSDWNERYSNCDTPWETNRSSTELKRILCERSVVPCDALEVGCGTGTNAVYLAHQGFQVTAIDLSGIAIERAELRAAEEGVAVEFIRADILNLPDLNKRFRFVFDRGVYHVLRRVNVDRFVEAMASLTLPGGLYLALAGNANEKRPREDGPPLVSAQDICQEFHTAFDLVQLREFHFDSTKNSGRTDRPLAWSILMRRK